MKSRSFCASEQGDQAATASEKAAAIPSAGKRRRRVGLGMPPVHAQASGREDAGAIRAWFGCCDIFIPVGVVFGALSIGIHFAEIRVFGNRWPRAVAANAAGRPCLAMLACKKSPAGGGRGSWSFCVPRGLEAPVEAEPVHASSQVVDEARRRPQVALVDRVHLVGRVENRTGQCTPTGWQSVLI